MRHSDLSQPNRHRLRAVFHVARAALVVLAGIVLGAFSATSAEQPVLSAQNSPIVLVLDASGSMAASLGDETRLDAARRVVLNTLASLPPSRPVGLVAYGHRRTGDCGDIETLSAIGPVDRPAIQKALDSLRARGKTPLSAALRHAAAMLPPSGGTVMLVSDGLETCHEDPCLVVSALRGANANLVFHVVGFGLAEDEMRHLACIAENGGGEAVEASTAAGLEEALVTLTENPGAAPGASAEAEASADASQKPAEPPPPVAQPVTFKAMVGGTAAPGPVLFSITSASGETVYAGKGIAVAPSLVPGPYTVLVTEGNVRTRAEIVVSGDRDESHEIALDAGLARLSVSAGPGLDIKDIDLKGDPVWSLTPKDGQGAAELAAVLSPEAMLAPGRYEIGLRLGAVSATSEITVAAGKVLDTTLDLRLGKVALEAGTPGGAALDAGAGLSWSLTPQPPGAAPFTAEGVARPVLVVPAGPYIAQLTIDGATIAAPVMAEAGKTVTARIDLPSATLILSGALGPGAPVFTDWRDASWTVRPVELIGGTEAGAALENQAEASPSLVLVPGAWDVTLVSGAASVTQRIVLAPGARLEQRIDLAAGRLALAAAPQEGAKAPLNVVLSLYPAGADGGFAEKPILEVGTARDYAAILPAGRYQVVALDETGRKADAEVTLAPGQSLDLPLTLK